MKGLPSAVVFAVLLVSVPAAALDQPSQPSAVAEAPQEKQPQQEQPLPQVGSPPDHKQVARTAEATAVFQEGGILTPRGNLVVEPSLQYSHSSSNRVALVGYTIIPSVTIGLIDIRNVERNNIVAGLALRYGITSRLEAETKVPFVYRADSSTEQVTGEGAADKVFNSEGYGIGDVEFGLRYQLNRSVGDRPIYIFGVRVKSNTGKDPFEVPLSRSVDQGGVELPTELPTGTGFWGIQPSLAAIFPSDPAVLFGSVNYLWNIERSDVPGFGRVDPGDIIGFSFGMGLSLNDKASLSLGYDHSVVGKVKFNDEVAPGSLLTQVGSLLIGYSYKLSDKRNVNVSIGAGLTEAAPDVQLTVRLPITL